MSPVANDYVCKTAKRNDSPKGVKTERSHRQRSVKTAKTYENITRNNRLGVAGGLVIAGDVLYNSEVKASHAINAVMTGIAFTGWGAHVAGIWFVADFGT